jgi:hypothetical protein
MTKHLATTLVVKNAPNAVKCRPNGEISPNLDTPLFEPLQIEEVSRRLVEWRKAFNLFEIKVTIIETFLLSKAQP